MTPEGKIQAAVVEYARDEGCMVAKFDATFMRGWPDRMLLKNGGVVFIEFKAPGEKPELIQSVIHDQLRAQGFAVVVVDNIRDGFAVIDELAKMCPDI